MKRALLLLCGFSLCQAFVHPHELKHIDKVILWGHKSDGHTHRWIHHGFSRAFEYLGYKTYWVDDEPNHDIDFAHSLFIVHGLVDEHVPLRNDCRYILHNCTSPKYRELFQEGNAVVLQVYTHDCLQRRVFKVAECTYVDFMDKVLYMPWATDLLPHEIDEIKHNIKEQGQPKERAVHFVGTVSHPADTSAFSNFKQMDAFIQGCRDNGVRFNSCSGISMEENIQLMQRSLLAPAIQCEWQCKQGYVPCRIFKNISYGQMGVTNSKTVYDLFKGKIVYNDDPYQLALDAIEHAEKMKRSKLFELMDWVRDQHTYINRIELLLYFLNAYKAV